MFVFSYKTCYRKRIFVVLWLGAQNFGYEKVQRGRMKFFFGEPEGSLYEVLKKVSCFDHGIDH
jgi:hypothetical protein